MTAPDRFERAATLLLAMLVGAGLVMSLCLAARCRAEHVEARCVPPACATCLGSRSERERAQRQQRAQDTAAARAAQSQQALPLAPAKRPRRSP